MNKVRARRTKVCQNSEMKLISDEEVAKLEADQRRPKATADRRRSFTIATIHEMRDLESRLARVRAFVEEMEDDEEDAIAIKSILDEERLPPPTEEGGPRPDRRKRRILQLGQRLAIARGRQKDIFRIIRNWPDDDLDGVDILTIFADVGFIQPVN
jgi:hypothetical protein